MSEEGWVEESMIREALGVSRQAVKKMRDENLVEGVDFRRVKNRVELTQEAAKRLVQHTGKGDPEKIVQAAAEGLPAAEKKSRREDGKVTRIFAPNHLVLECELPGGDLVPVRVRDNRKFIVGQVIPLIQGDGCLWFLDAPQPHVRGRIHKRAN